MKLFSAEQWGQWDNYTIENEPITSIHLIERAAAALVEQFISIVKPCAVHVFCGKGKNAADGVAMASLLNRLGYSVFVYLIETPKPSSELAELVNIHRRELKYKIIPDVSQVKAPNQGVVIDCLLGTGFKGELTEPYRHWIAFINGLNLPVVAIDLPSGMHVDTAVNLNETSCIRATYTLTVEGWKPSFTQQESLEFLGAIKVAKAGLHPQFYAQTVANRYVICASEVNRIWQPKSMLSTKHTHGHHLVIGGSQGKWGAPILTAAASARMGSGLNSIVWVDPPQQVQVPWHIMQLDVHPEDIKWSRFSHVTLGPGMGTSQRAHEWVKAALEQQETPALFDADALNIVAAQHWIPQMKAGTILTPHQGEALRLIGSNAKAEFIVQKVLEQGLIWVDKQARTAVYTPNGEVWYNSAGNAALATGGTGDVLAGIIGGAAARWKDPAKACICGVFLHGYAADLYAQRLGTETLIASDIIESLPHAIHQLRST
ncbi:MAG TPA: NAD(P)H-hydrate dehydratase [Luteibaculaceae bacterium]|nr:NAD(P)H-hydrate dehydratase [Luteibaculaceae bacterium]